MRIHHHNKGVSLMELCEPLQELQKKLPPLFAGTELDNLTGKGYCWRSLQNEKSLGKVPEDVFLRSGSKKLLVVRDNFLAHWQTKIGSGKAR
jgi:hypothetical protein